VITTLVVVELEDLLEDVVHETTEGRGLRGRLWNAIDRGVLKLARARLKVLQPGGGE